MRYHSAKALILFFFILSPLIRAQESPEPQAIIDTLLLNCDLFGDDEPMVITMKFNIKEYQRNKKQGEYMPAELIYHINDTLDIYKSIRLKARGNFRRSYCSMPPLWLNIHKADIKNARLQDVRRMKVVTHCVGGTDASNYVLKEFLAYRIYNMLTPYSFRVRLIRMKYVDTGRNNRTSENWAFVIEPEILLAQRENMIPLEHDRMAMSQMAQRDMDRVALFQYMVGNADYSITGRHNIKLIVRNESGRQQIIPVPYDFDYSGLVNASYAVPGENLGIQSVRERYYLGICRDMESFMGTVDLFTGKEQEIMDFVESFPYLDKRNKSDMNFYLNDFFHMAENPDLLYRFTQATCRQ